MKYFLLTILCSFSFYLAKSQTNELNKFIIKGILTGYNTSVIKISYLNKNQVWVDDTAQVNNHNFFFSGIIDQPTLITVSGNIKSRSLSDPNFTKIFIEPRITVIHLTENSFKDAVVEGSHSQTLFDELKALERPIEESGESLKKSYSAVKEAYAKGDTSKMITDSIENLRVKLIPLQDKLKDIDLKFVEDNKNEFISSYILGLYTGKMSHDSLQSYYDRLSNPVKYNTFGHYIYKALMHNQRSTAFIGSAAPNINMRDLNDKIISLASFKSKKYVLLDFWASWCIPCRRMNPYLQKIYKKYKDKDLEIISLSMDYDKIAWKNAIQKDQLNSWNHILVGQNGESADYIKDNYNLLTVPAYILIDKNGIIIGRYEVINEDNKGSLIEKLKEVL